MSVYIGAAKMADYTAMQGPCPTGFHVPTVSEFQGVEDIMTGLSLTSADDYRFKLHLPLAGRVRQDTVAHILIGSYGWYRTSTPRSEGDSYTYYTRLNGSYGVSSGARNNGYSLRAFKNEYVEPTSSWTVEQGTLGGAGLFWNQTDGLISITDGTVGYTMMDKNLGATEVLTQSGYETANNCGSMFQRGNNYGFSYTSSEITTSSTQVNASNYGPGNYYNSSSFIAGSFTDWSNVRNDNLWGGNSTIPKGLKSAYIGDYIAPREPNTNTVAYWPLNSATTVNDQSGNGYNLTQHSGGFTTIDGVSCFYTNAGSGSGYLDLTSASLIPTGDAARTILFWIRSTGYSSSRPTYCFNYGGSDQETGFNVFISATTRRSLSTNNTTITGGNTQFNTWQLIAATSSGNTFYLYVDGAHKQTATPTQYNINTSAISSGLPLVLMRRWGSYTNTQSDGYLSEVIIENRQRSDAEITAYYNHTKGNYGIS